MVIPANDETTLPVKPGPETLDERATLVPAKHAAIQRHGHLPVRAMSRDHLDALFREPRIQPMGVVRLVADEPLGLNLDHVEVEGQLDQRDLVVIGGRPLRSTISMILTPPLALRRPDVVAATLGRRERRVDEALRRIKGSRLTRHVRQLIQGIAQHIVAAPLLKSDGVPW